ncbi:MAG: UDP-3-O-acyl-N-acetylglucosamine deacetylase [Acidobacteria bacterium]|nr:UDP-3-O-acyl-N-acetylglucosamine deacetylase [Acidobacteriota bacterium]
MVERQTTLGRSFTTEGVGLHSNSPVRVTVNPAPAYTGYLFRRSDLNYFEIPASPENVTHVSYATTIMKSGVMVSTIEHLLSALYGCGIDNALIDVDSLEVPILDGSSQPWVEMIVQAGTSELLPARHYLQVLKKIEVREKNRTIMIEPGEFFQIYCEIDFAHPLIGHQQFETKAGRDGYVQEIAPARTFGFTHELEQLRQNGLARGGSLENAIALTPDGILNPEPLRFPNEFVRHKILDIIGDLALCGMPIKGRVYAERSGHGLHTMLLSSLLRDSSAWEIRP